MAYTDEGAFMAGHTQRGPGDIAWSKDVKKRVDGKWAKDGF